ncbi:hypothetical protein FPV67DRAFT_1671057 [Lyophyllum atratum]|nr:hypothetical protein FPV67DRAFT_1671057 [Lyophyllum atratum]
MRFTVYLIAFAFAAGEFFSVQAAPIAERQLLKGLGGIGCNVARVQTVASLAAASRAVAKVTTASAADATAGDAAAAAKTGLDSAKAGIATIATALVTGQAPPEAACTQTLDGLNAAKTALAGITSTDPAVTSAVADAAAKVDKTIAAGGKVVAKC